MHTTGFTTFSPSITMSMLLVLFISLFIPSVNSKLPSFISQDLYCATCKVSMSVIAEGLEEPSSDPLIYRVGDILETLCKARNFNFTIHGYLPPDMAQACKHLLGEHEYEIEQSVMKYYQRGRQLDKLILSVCQKIAYACKGLHHNSDTKAETIKSKTKYTIKDESGDDFEIKLDKEPVVPSPQRETSKKTRKDKSNSMEAGKDGGGEKAGRKQRTKEDKEKAKEAARRRPAGGEL